MAQFTYNAPDARSFMHTLLTYLQVKKDSLADLLAGASCNITTTQNFSGNRWNAFDATVTFLMPVEQTVKFDEYRQALLQKAVDAVFPEEAGYDLTITISPLIEAPPDESEPLQNTGSLVRCAPYEHDGLRFRSKTEIRIYDELKKRDVLFFANSTAVLGRKDVKREPDFLVCQNGKWGILEVMGEPYHPAATAMRDHDRARLFKDYGLLCIEFYDASKCYNDTDWVVTDFLGRLGRI